jgi:hypothetical protein
MPNKVQSDSAIYVMGDTVNKTSILSMASDSTLSYLFPTPGLAPSALSPTRLPGGSPESSIALRTVLKDNHVKWHIFNNELRYHKYVPFFFPRSSLYYRGV